MEKTKQKEDITKGYAPIGKAFCEGKCQKKVIRTEEGVVVVCNGCRRVVMDNR